LLRVGAARSLIRDMKIRLPAHSHVRRVRSIVCRGAATALIACTGPALAQSGLINSGPANSEAEETGRTITSLPQWMLRAQQRLALDQAQQRELGRLVRASAERMREMSASGSRHAYREEMAALRREFRESLVGILSTEQLAEWDALLAELLGEIHLRHAPLLVNGAH
jgi:hypothetical protein